MVFPGAALVLSLGFVQAAQDTPRSSPVCEGVIVATGTYYRVHVHYDDQDAADQVLELVEAVWPLTMKMLGTTDAPAPEWPLPIHVYPSKDAYAEVEAWLTNGHFRETESFAHWDSRSAHVALAPPLSPGAKSEAVVSSQTREVLLHEAAHLALYTVIPSYRWHPTWFAEGFAMTVEFELAQRFGLVSDPATHPRFSTNQLRARRLLEEGRIPTIASILDESLDGLSFDEKYAIWLEFFRVLQAPGNERSFRKLVIEMRRLGGGPGMRSNAAAFMRDEYGEKRLAEALRKRLAGLRFEWDEVTRSLETVGDEWLQCAFPSHDALAWRTEPVGRSTYAIQGRFVLLGSSSTDRSERFVSQMHIVLDRAPDGHFGVQFRPGRISIVRYDATDIETLAEVECSSLVMGEEYAFRVDVSRGIVEVAIDGVMRVSKRLADRDLDGPWGLGVQRAGSGFWRGVRLLR